MKTKLCTKCKKDLPITKFSKDNRRKSGLQNNCKNCRHIQYKSWCASNKEYTNKYRREQKRLRYLYLLTYLSKHGCVDCGETDPIVLEFDHVKGKKISELSRMAHSRRPIDIIQKEIEKCEIRCSNCHKIKTAKEQNWYHYVDFSTMTLKPEQMVLPNQT